jgi:hypothetical protein
MVALLGGRGYVEIKTESDASSRDSRGGGRKIQIVAFFYQMDGTTPISPTPTDVKVKVGNLADSPFVDLSSGAKGGDAAPNRFASKPGPYPEGFEGRLDATVNGEPIQTPFLFR